MQVELMPVSPVAFMLAKEGDMALIKRSAPRRNEYRDKIGPADEAFLVFKGGTKIGMIPRDIMSALPDVQLRRTCRITKMDRHTDVVVVELLFAPVAG